MGNKRELLAKILTGKLAPDAIKIPGRVSPPCLLQVIQEGEDEDIEQEYIVNTPDKGDVVVKWKDADAFFEQYEETAIKEGQEQLSRFLVIVVTKPPDDI